MKIESFLRPHIVDMEAYTPILPLEILSKQLGVPIEKIIKLDANENPYGVLPEVKMALARLPYVHIYPDPESQLLRKAIGNYYKLPVENILPGAGADELIDLIMRLMLDPGDKILNCPPTFGMYAFDAEANNAQVISVARKPDFSLDFEGIIAAIDQHRHKILFLANPNNPDGSLIPPEMIERLLDLPILLVLDEAYVDFADEGTSWISRMTFTPNHLDPNTARSDQPPAVHENKKSNFPNMAMRNNLIILRTFSKWAGLAGLRVGFGVFPDWMMPHLWKIKQPYNVSVAAQTAAIVSLENADQLEIQGKAIIAERERLSQALREISWLKPYPSQTNFILCKVIGKNAGQIKTNLAVKGILIRYFNKSGLQDHIRISVGKPEDSNVLVHALKSEN